MPRDATETRARLLLEAERLFATRGYHQTTTREITAQAVRAVPEPSSIAAIAIALSMMGVMYRRRARHSDLTLPRAEGLN